jgi:hypothetical protein
VTAAAAAPPAPKKPLDVRGWPTRAVFLLIVAAFFDLLLLIPRVIVSLFCARVWRARTRRMIFTESA